MNAASNLLGKFVDLIINPAILVVFTAGFFLFLWGLVIFLWNLNEGASSNGKQHMLWGIVGMLIMISVYGIITLVDQTFQLDIANPDISRMNNTVAPANFFGR